MELLSEYGLFLAKAVTIVVAIIVLLSVGASLSRRGKPAERLEVIDLNRKFRNMALTLKKTLLPKKEYLKALKEERTRRKRRTRKAASEEQRKKIFVIDFQGDMRATAVRHLREEVSAVLTQATPDDEVLVRLENAGGLVHDHGLAAAQLARIRRREIPLTVAVDKVAASGGYLMACVANKILASPFAVVGSIGVLMEIPNFNRFLDNHGVQFEVIKGGDLKRTLTLFGRNTDEDRERAREQVEDTHSLLKDFVSRYRPELDITRVATGEHWHGTRALELKLVDELATSDDYLMDARKQADLYLVRYRTRKAVTERLAAAAQSLLGPRYGV